MNGEGWSGGERAESPGDENVVSFNPNKGRGGGGGGGGGGGSRWMVGSWSFADVFQFCCV